MALRWWVLIGMALLVAGLVFESARQRRKMKRLGQDPDRIGGRAIGAGILELQGMLQPDRKVEILAMQAKEKEGSSELASDEEGEGFPPEDEEDGR